MKKLWGVTMEGDQWELAVKPRSGRTKDPYKALACAIVLQAVEDYKKCKSCHDEVRRFLLSGFCDLIDMNGKVILKQLDQELENKQSIKTLKRAPIGIVEVYDGANRELLGRYKGYRNAAEAIGKSTTYIRKCVERQEEISYGYLRKPKYFFKVFIEGEKKE